MNMISSLAQLVRLRYGMFWPKKHPPMPWRFLFMTAAVIAFAYQSLRAIEAEEVAENNAGLATVTLACMNGASGFYWKDAGLSFSCGQPL